MLITRKIIQTFIYSQLCYYNPNKTSYRIYKQFYIVQYVFVILLDIAWLNRFLYFWELKWQILLPGGS